MNLTWVIPAKGGHTMSHSHKIYVAGSRSDIRVPMREIILSGGEPPLRLYDTSGPYTDANAHTDIKRGLPPLRSPWVLDRGDVEELPGPTSQYRRRRDDDPSLGGVRFASVRRPLRARPGRVVTQMHYARRGVVTPEMRSEEHTSETPVTVKSRMPSSA